MHLESRQQDILRLIGERGFVSTEQLSEHFGVTSQTIRRDINALCEMGLAKKKHGGVTVPPSISNHAYSARSMHNSVIKQEIGAIAEEHIEPGSTVFLGYGTTVMEFAKSIKPGKPLTIVTNNINAALIVSELPDIEIWIAGGRMRNQHKDIMGSLTMKLLQSFRADYAICSCAGISDTGELLEFQYEEAEITELLLSRSKQRFLLADSSKFLRSASVTFATMRDVDMLFTDCDDPALLALCEENQLPVRMTGK